MLQRMLALLALTLVVAACNGPATSSLTVTSLVPADEATGVAVDTVVSATFNLGIDVDTLDGAFTLTGGGATVDGDLAYDAGSRTATFTPDGDLAFDTEYTATVDGSVATDDGVTLGGSASWSFTTVAENGADPADPMAFVGADAYPDFTGDADVTEPPFSLPFPSFTGGQAPFTYTLESGALPPTFEAQAYVNPETGPVDAATYTVTLDPDDGTIAGVTGFPGLFEGVVRVTDSAGDFLEASFSLDLAFVMAYDGSSDGFARDVTVDAGIAVEGARVTISGTNALALPDTGMDRTFTLTFVPAESSGSATAGDFAINVNDGTISKVEAGSTFPAVWVYDVSATHDATGRTSETYRYTFTLLEPEPDPDPDPEPDLGPI